MSIGKGYEVDFEDNSNYILGEWEDRKDVILYAIGLKWQSICNEIITRIGIVDTGRLKGSLTFITETQRGGSISAVPENRASDYLSGSTDEDTLIVGSNVKYAAKQELGNSKGSFLKPSITDHRDDYMNVTKHIMEQE